MVQEGRRRDLPLQGMRHFRMVQGAVWGRTVTSLTVAFGFLTIIPVSHRAWESPESFGRAFAWFPLVGWALAGVLALVASALNGWLPSPALAAVLVGLWVLLTGGLHLDGLMDSCDGLFCARLADERLEIMRDPHTGAFGVLGAVCVLLLKYGALSALLSTPDMFHFALLLAPVLGRWAMVIATVCFPYGRKGETLGSAFRKAAGVREMVLASASMLLIILLTSTVTGTNVLAALGAATAAGLLTWGLALWALRRLPGLTGDLYGATNEVVEAAVLIIFSARWLG